MSHHAGDPDPPPEFPVPLDAGGEFVVVAVVVGDADEVGPPPTIPEGRLLDDEPVVDGFVVNSFGGEV
jgi:hypothetical protein